MCNNWNRNKGNFTLHRSIFYTATSQVVLYSTKFHWFFNCSFSHLFVMLAATLKKQHESFNIKKNHKAATDQWTEQLNRIWCKLGCDCSPSPHLLGFHWEVAWSMRPPWTPFKVPNNSHPWTFKNIFLMPYHLLCSGTLFLTYLILPLTPPQKKKM